MVSKHQGRANNPIAKEYHSSKQNSNILYLHGNNMYGWAMTHSLPTSAFDWVEHCHSLEES